MLEMVPWIWALPRHEAADKKNWHLATLSIIITDYVSLKAEGAHLCQT